MTEEAQIIEPPRKTLHDIHVGWAKWALSILRLKYPQVEAQLYKKGSKFFIVCTSLPDGLTIDIFDQKIRPITCNIELSLISPRDADLLDDGNNYEEELWLGGQPLPVATLNQLLMLTAREMPRGGIDFDSAKDEWVFTSEHELSTEERMIVINGLKKINQIGSIRFQSSGTGSGGLTKGDELWIAPSQTLHHLPRKLTEVIEKDEDTWRDFVSSRSRREISSPEKSSKFDCLFDTADTSDVKLSELLCLYDTINLIPQIDDASWMQKHQLSIAHLQSLVEMGRVRITLPGSVERYPSDLVGAIVEANPDALIPSRSLARRAIQRGQQKDPLLYAPLTVKERAFFLKTLTHVCDQASYKHFLQSYARIFEGQHYALATQGANALIGHGIGACLGDLIFKMRGQDARLELMINGSAIEWAMGLNASYIPRNLQGFDETKNSLIIASFLGRTKVRDSDPITQRMHTTIDGLLSVSDIPPIEVAQNFNSLSLSRFRNIANKIMSQVNHVDDIQTVVDALNAEVKSFEAKKGRLKAWKVDSLLVAALVKPIGGLIDAKLGYCGSIASFWLMEHLKTRLPPHLHNEWATALELLTGLGTGTSIDAVIVSRSNKMIH